MSRTNGRQARVAQAERTQSDGKRVVYVSALISNDAFAKYFGTGRKVPSIAAQKFHRLLVEGMAADPRVSEVVVVGAPPVSRAISKKLIHTRHESQQGNIRFIGLPFINVPVLRQAGILVGTLYGVLRESGGDAVVVCDVLSGAPSIGALLARHLAGKLSVGVVTDVPRRRPRVGKASRRIAAQAAELVNTAWLGRFDAYLLLTEPMNSVVNPHQRPHVTIEGLVDTDLHPPKRRNLTARETRVILYTGSTHQVYGLPMLVEAFRGAGLEDWELHICGSGDYDEDLRLISALDKRVQFHGVVDNNEAVRRQIEAEVLINPRPTHGEFTRYSFPSKNMEYMASGRPLIATRLPGMPPEYEPHIIALTDESVAGYRSTLRKVANMDPQELDLIGAAAQRFVMSEKNKIAQAKKFMDLIGTAS